MIEIPFTTNDALCFRETAFGNLVYAKVLERFLSELDSFEPDNLQRSDRVTEFGNWLVTSHTVIGMGVNAEVFNDHSHARDFQMLHFTPKFISRFFLKRLFIDWIVLRPYLREVSMDEVAQRVVNLFFEGHTQSEADNGSVRLDNISQELAAFYSELITPSGSRTVLTFDSNSGIRYGFYENLNDDNDVVLIMNDVRRILNRFNKELAAKLHRLKDNITLNDDVARKLCTLGGKSGDDAVRYMKDKVTYRLGQYQKNIALLQAHCDTVEEIVTRNAMQSSAAMWSPSSNQGTSKSRESIDGDFALTTIKISKGDTVEHPRRPVDPAVTTTDAQASNPTSAWATAMRYKPSAPSAGNLPSPGNLPSVGLTKAGFGFAK